MLILFKQGNVYIIYYPLRFSFDVQLRGHDTRIRDDVRNKSAEKCREDKPWSLSTVKHESGRGLTTVKCEQGQIYSFFTTSIITASQTVSTIACDQMGKRTPSSCGIGVDIEDRFASSPKRGREEGPGLDLPIGHRKDLLDFLSFSY